MRSYGRTEILRFISIKSGRNRIRFFYKCYKRTQFLKYTSDLDENYTSIQYSVFFHEVGMNVFTFGKVQPIHVGYLWKVSLWFEPEGYF